jgi:hypothetical protein
VNETTKAQKQAMGYALTASIMVIECSRFSAVTASLRPLVWWSTRSFCSMYSPFSSGVACWTSVPFSMLGGSCAGRVVMRARGARAGKHPRRYPRL